MSNCIKHLILTVGLLCIFNANAQRLIDRVATVRFFSEAPLENIDAVNSQAMGALDLSNGNVAVSMLMKQFEFDKSLMQEHFNENYVESDKFPKGTFSGTLEAFDQQVLKDLKDSVSFAVSGNLTIHGVTNSLESIVWFKKEQNQLVTKTVFIVDVASFDIEIPKMVVMNIAEQVEVTATFTFDMIDR